MLPLRPGVPARQTHDYKRHGATTLFAALNMLDGTVIGDCMPRHRHQEFIRFLQTINPKTLPDLMLRRRNVNCGVAALSIESGQAIVALFERV